MLPFLQIPDAAGHDDRHLVRDAALAHRLAQRLDARIGILRNQRVFGVGKAVMAAGQPGILIDHGGEIIGELGISALRSEEHTSELQSLMRKSYAVFCLKKKNNNNKR